MKWDKLSVINILRTSSMLTYYLVLMYDGWKTKFIKINLEIYHLCDNIKFRSVLMMEWSLRFGYTQKFEATKKMKEKNFNVDEMIANANLNNAFHDLRIQVLQVNI